MKEGKTSVAPEDSTAAKAIAGVLLVGFVVVLVFVISVSRSGNQKATPTPGERSDYAAFLNSRFGPDGISVTTSGPEGRTLQFDAREASLAMIQALPKVWMDPEHRQALRTLGFETVNTLLPGDVDSKIDLTR